MVGMYMLQCACGGHTTNDNGSNAVLSLRYLGSGKELTFSKPKMLLPLSHLASPQSVV